MAEHPNAAVLRRFLDAMNEGDETRLDALVADDVEWHQIGSDEPIVGKAELAARMLGDARDYTVTAEVHDVVANDDHVIALVSAHATRGERTLDYRTAEICHVRDGRITARWAFSDDTAAINAFFA